MICYLLFAHIKKQHCCLVVGLILSRELVRSLSTWICILIIIIMWSLSLRHIWRQYLMCLLCENLKSFQLLDSILPPLSVRSSVPPKMKRIPSRGEKIRQIKCGRYGKIGNHNRKRCKINYDLLKFGNDFFGVVFSFLHW